jgi:PAS domain S-box-containing protein
MKDRNFYSGIIHKSPFGYAHHEIILDDNGHPFDYRFLDINPAFEKLTGLRKENLIGQSIRQAIPGIEKTAFDWIAFYGKIALEGGEEEFEQYSEPLKKWFQVHVYSTEKMFFTTIFTDITHTRKQHEELEGFFSVSLDLFCIADLEGNFVKTNEAWSIFLGYSVEELNKKKFLEFVHRDDLPATLKAIEKLSAGEDLLNFTNRYLTSDGTYRHIEWRSHPKGNLIYASARDVTEGKLFQEELIETRANLTAIVENTFDSIWSINTNYQITYINQVFANSFHAAFGIALKPGSNLLQSLPQPIRPLWKERYDRVLAGERIVFIDAVEANDGNYIHIEVAANPIIKHDLVIGASLFGRDITERKSAEISLRESEEFNRKLLTTIPDLVIRTDIEGNITFVNEPGLKNFTFIAYHEIIGRNILSFIHPKDMQRAVENSRLMFEKPLGVKEYTLQMDDNHLYECEINGEVVRDSDGKPTGMVYVIRDVTQRKQAEEALEKRLVALTQPLESAEGITINDLFNLADIQKLQDEFARAAGVASIITHPDGKPITEPSNFRRLCSDIIRKTEIGCANCFKSDAVLGKPNIEGPTIQPCLSGGLWDAGAAISVGGRHIANWLVGQVRDKEQTEENMRNYARIIGADEEAVVEAFKEVPAMDHRQFENVAGALHTLANQLSTLAYQNVQQARFITQRKDAEKALRESEQKFRGMAENMIDVLFLTDTKGIITYISPSCKVLFKFHEEEMTGRPFGNFLRHDQLEAAYSEFKKMLSTGEKVYNFPLIILDAEKNEVHAELTSSTYMIEGELIGAIGLLRDVTESRATQLELLKLSQAISQSPVSIVITDLHGNIEYINPHFSALTGYTQEEAKGQNPRILKSGEQPDDIYRELWDAISKGDTWQGELLNKKKNGDLFWESVSIAPIFNSDQKITNYIAVKEDITLRKAMEESLRQQSMLRKLLMEISSGFINIPFNKVDQAVNDALKKMAQFVNADRAYTFDYDWENDICDNIYEWCAEGIRPEIDNLQGVPLSMMQDWVEAHRKGEPMYVPDVFRLPRGAVREILEPQGIKSVLSVPMMNEGACIGFVGFDSVRKHHHYTDVEKQLLQLFAQLLANVTLRKEIVKQLVVAKEKAEESDHLKTAFLQNLSHEVRTPINGIIGFADLLTDDDNSPEDQKKYAGIIIERGNQLTAIINDILTISALETGQEQLYNVMVNVNSLINNQLAMFADQANEKDIQLISKCNLPDNEAIVFADKTKLRQILNNLFTNALKFTKSGTVELGYNLKDQFIEFYLKDTGIGIAKEKQHLIFERFAQADDYIRRDFGGTGLGLSICKGFVELMGGNIRLDSEPGRGAIFYFTIPYKPINHSTTSSKLPSLKTSNDYLTVLVAEDEETNFRLLEMILKKLNFNIIRAENGESAVEMCKQHNIDLVLMDIKMPVMNGYAAARIIKELKPDLPIIAQTAHAVQSEIEAYNDAFDDYITKPFTKTVISRAINKFMPDGDIV